MSRILRIALATAALPLSVHADLIPIVNPSFELVSRPLEVGQQTNGAGGTGVPLATRYPFGGGSFSWDNPVEVPGWRTLTTQPGSPSIVYAGILNPPLLGGQPFIANHDGQHIAALQVARMGQTLTTQIAPDTHYTLRFKGGIGLFGSDYFLSASLIVVPDLLTLPHEGQAGVERLVLSQGATPPPQSFGTMLEYSIEYTSPAILPPNLAGKFLGIHMWGSDGIPRVLYDDFRLEATPVPSPAALIPLLTLLASTRRTRPGPLTTEPRPSGSGPVPNQ
jgi:hypothetical protein